MQNQDVYEGFEIEISRCTCETCDRWEVRILSSPFDRPRAKFVPPYEPKEFQVQMESLEELILSRDESEVTKARARAREIGRKLRDAIMVDGVGETFRRCVREAAERDGPALRVRFSFGSPKDFRPEIVGLPWELLLEPDTEGFLSRGARSQVVRYVDLPVRTEAIEIPRPLRVLAVMASPQVDWLSDIDDLIEQHRQGLLERLRRRPDVRVRFLRKPTLTALKTELDRRDYHVLHYLGHGDLEEENGRGFLFFEDDQRGCKPVSGETLAELLERPGVNPLRVAVINACQGAKTPRQGHHRYWAGVGNALVAHCFPAVVAMQFSISEKAAVAFSEGFYDALAAGKPVDVAVAEGRQQIMADAEVPDTLEWATPVLTLRTRDARIFEVEDSAPPPVRLGVLSINDFGGEEIRDESDRLLDLTDLFPSGQFHDPPGGEDFWNREVGPRLRRFLKDEVADRYPNQLDFAAQQSLAFAAGFFVPAKAGVEIWVGQRSDRPRPKREGTEVWKPTDPVSEDAPRWQPREVEILDQRSADLAVAVGPTWPAAADVKRYLDPRDARATNRSEPPVVGRLWTAELEGEPGNRKVLGGGHAAQLAERLAQDLNRLLAERPASRVHFFGSAPNAFWVFLGRECRLLSGEVRLYEFVRQGRTYVPSLTLPLPSPATSG